MIDIITQEKLDSFKQSLKDENISYGELAEIDRYAVIHLGSAADRDTEELIDLLQEEINQMNEVNK